tara:strand:+ start:16267 stop:16677 length:411 start_codon:yes stop_codon:yes gene_type:complete
MGDNNRISILDGNGNENTPPTIAIDMALDEDNTGTILDVPGSLYRAVLNMSAIIKLLLVGYHEYLFAFATNSPLLLTAIDVAMVAGFSGQGIPNLCQDAVGAGQDLQINKLPRDEFDGTCTRLMLTANQRGPIERF